ncbi:class I SAM-dependent methyltransferase [Flammeovirgaceae bacterium SG7u.111]|nr:class I SAM-dependent methyltransferase [Flammeovirgaceae bacterium SG7u.132]WPO34600.1 class I SAM-dependent methyltransferase [Flammeovirgaceae bacterium SG7u.111]
MTFYQSIATYYHLIFSTGKPQVEFVKNTEIAGKTQSVLDIGCAIGGLSAQLCQHFGKVVGIDLDEGMIERAKEENDLPNLSFQELDMLKIEGICGAEAFDIVACFGNTLVHLDGTEEIADFFVQARKVLKVGGKLLFQIVNYDRILDQNITALPTLDKEEITFERNYEYLPETHKIKFATKFKVKATGEETSNAIDLYPLRKAEAEELLRKAGFTKINFYSNFQRKPYEENAMPLIVEAG